MQADVGRTVGKGGVEHRLGDKSCLVGGHVATGAERSEVDLVSQRLSGFDGRCDVRAGLPFDERFYGELQQQHASAL